MTMIKIKRGQCYLSQKHFSKQMFFTCACTEYFPGCIPARKECKKDLEGKNKTLDVTEAAEHHRNEKGGFRSHCLPLLPFPQGVPGTKTRIFVPGMCVGVWLGHLAGASCLPSRSQGGGCVKLQIRKCSMYANKYWQNSCQTALFYLTWCMSVSLWAKKEVYNMWFTIL